MKQDTPQQPSRLSLIKKQAAEGTLHQGSIVAGGRKVVGIEKLVEDPENERKTFDDMDDLVASVKAHGVVEPLTVLDIGGNKYQVITGHRRLRAAKIAGLAQIEVLIREPEEKWERRKKSLVSNVQRADVRPLELAESLRLLLDNDPKIKTQDDLAQAIGKDKTWVSHMLRILDLPEALKVKVGTSQLLIPADAVSKVARLEDPKMQAELIDELLAGGTVRDIRERIAVHKGKAPTKAKSESAHAKPKKVFQTEQKAVVIVQSMTSRLTNDQVVAALQEALKDARKPK